MKIVHLTWGLGVGGAETMLADIAGRQAAVHDTWIVVGNQDIDAAVAASVHPSVKILKIGRPPGSKNPWYLIMLALWIRRTRADVVHAHHESFGRLRRLIGAPMLLTVHNTRLPLGRGIHDFDSVVCISEAVRQEVQSRFPRIRPRVVGNGIDFEAVRLKTAYGARPFRIVQVSRLAHEQKGQDLLIRSLRRVLDEAGEDSVQIDFIGEGGSLDFLKRLAVECRVDAHCRFLGAATRAHVYEVLGDYDLLVQPSRYEGFGLTVVEGVAAGVPVLVSDIEGPREIVSGGALGWSFRSEDTRDLSNKIIELLSLSRQPDFAAQMHSRTQLGRSRFDIERTAREYMEEYGRLGARTATRAKPPSVMVIEACDFDEFPMGGQLTTVKQLLSVFGNRLALVGVSTADEPVGRWTKKCLDGVEFDFFSIGRVDPVIKKPPIPRRLETYIRLKRHRKGILSLGATAGFVIAPEVMLAIEGWGLRVAYTFAGVENPLTMPRYPIGRWIAGPFERRFFAALAAGSELIMAAADEKAIQAMKDRSRGRLDGRPVIPSPTLVDAGIFTVARSANTGAEPVFVSCGRLNVVKGWDLVLDAFLEVRKQIPAARLYFVGDGEDRGKLESRIDAAGVTESVQITGLLKPADVVRYLNSAHVFLLGSHREGWPTALLEAEACGLPAVATDVSGASSLIEPGRNGYIAKNRDPEEFARLIVAALALACPNPTSLKIAARHSLAGWKENLSSLWEPLR
jgi:glycosyltransferase involved in cell wall biosynthesis